MAAMWTEDQKRVINHKEGNLLVSAAAGSGKTAVLVQHVIDRLMDEEDPVSLSQMVVMTFTDAAAQEMRERIRGAIEEKLREHPGNELLIREAGNIQNSNISTIDSFCRRILMENYAVIGLDPSFRIGDEGELKLLKSDIIRDMMETHYQEQEECYIAFVDQFSDRKEDKGIEELILQVAEAAESHPWPMEYLRAEARQNNAEVEAFLIEDLRAGFRDDRDIIKEAIELCLEEDGPEAYLPALQHDLDTLEELLACDHLQEMVSAAGRYVPDRLPRSKSLWKDNVQNMRNLVKADLQELKKRLFLPDETTLLKMQADLDQHIRVLLELTQEYLDRYEEEKADRRILDFSDLEHKALEILYTGEGEERKPSLIADDYARAYREILVDEYQDSNLVQEELIRALSGERFGRPDVFQVGDVKQSIYSFRLARPDLFLTKLYDSTYPKIELSRNFRSRNTVLQSVNDVFYRIMKKEVGGIDYTDRSALYAGRNEQSEDEKAIREGTFRERDYTTELLVLGLKDAATETDAALPNLGKEEAEAELIAARIHKLRAEGYEYRDIVILMRSPGAWADKMVEILGHAGIPAYCITNEGYFTAVEVETILSLLSIIDNPRQSIPLAAVMRSPIGGFTDEELAELVAKDGTLIRSFPDMEADKDAFTKATLPSGEMEALVETEAPGELVTDKEPETFGESGTSASGEELPEALHRKQQSFFAMLDRFRRMSHYLTIHELLYRIYDETGYYNYASAMPAGNRRKANLDQLIDEALRFERTSYKGLFDFIRYIEKLKKYDNDQGEASVYSDQDNLVRIMSIHKSKGLQFPVVFTAGLSRQFNRSDLNAKLLIDPMLGMACDYIDPETRVRIPSLKKFALREKMEMDQLGEELRVLYVAMTRAQDKLILTATCSDLDKFMAKCEDEDTKITGSRIRSAQCYLDWITMAMGSRLLATGSSECSIRLQTLSLADLGKLQGDELKKTVLLSEELQQEISAYPDKSPLYQRMLEDFAYQYPHEAATKLYPKHSVSEIKEAAIEQYEKEAAAETWHITADHSGSSEQYLEPAGAMVGDAYHHALARYDYSKDMNQLAELLPEAEYKLINEKRFAAFLKTELAAEFRKAQEKRRLFREQHFMKEVPYNYLFPDSTLIEPILLQGIIDAFIVEEDGIVLVDYKSDHVHKEETLVGRYQKQLELYADALSSILQMPVKKKLIYSIVLERTIAV
ncbi:MAG: UvrD-helicase domain-containing protein [Oribacterium sp.]|nr:UvrD-helicase domain-containing protein [Oribacterium sp.]